MLRTINRLQSVSQGEVIVNKQDINQLKGKSLKQYRTKVGMIFQQFNLAASKTVYQNIAFNLEAAGWEKQEIDKRVEELLRFIQLEDKKTNYPAQLSGGQKQRVAIARALANHTEILLCDEPTSALDTETTAVVLDLLAKINRELGVTIVMITHELEVVKRICQRAAVMNQGKVVEINTVYNLFTQSQSDYTKTLIQREGSLEFPKEIRQHLMQQSVYKLLYLDEVAFENVLYRLGVQFQVQYNIVHGRIEFIGQKTLGTIFVTLEGGASEVENGLAFLRSQHILVKEVDFEN